MAWTEPHAVHTLRCDAVRILPRLVTASRATNVYVPDTWRKLFLESTILYSASICMRHNYERAQATIPRFKGFWAKWRVTRHDEHISAERLGIQRLPGFRRAHSNRNRNVLALTSHNQTDRPATSAAWRFSRYHESLVSKFPAHHPHTVAGLLMKDDGSEESISGAASQQDDLTCQQARLDSVVFESLHAHLSDDIRAHHKSVLRPGYRCLNNGQDDEAAVPRLCIVCPEQSRVLRHFTVQSSKKGPKFVGRAYDISRV